MRIPVTIYLQGENFDPSYDRIVAIDAATSCGAAGAYNVKGTMCLGEDFLGIEIEMNFSEPYHVGLLDSKYGCSSSSSSSSSPTPCPPPDTTTYSSYHC